MNINSKLREYKYLLALGLPVLSLAAVGFFRENFSEKIKDTKDLARIAIEETKNLNPQGKPLTIYWTHGRVPWRTAGSQKIADKTYKIVLDTKRNRTVVRHELYHIYAGHCDKAYSKGEWSSWDKVHDELTANFYAYYGIKL